jgi:hypothetical protein
MTKAKKEKEESLNREKEKNEIVPNSSEIIDLTKYDEQVDKTGVPIVNQSL